MKRSSIKRKTTLTARQPMRRKSTSPRRRESQSKMRKQSAAFRSPAYLRWVRSMPCCKCLGAADDAHHVIGLPWRLSGVGLTAPDNFSISVCRECHQKIHADTYLQQQQPDWLLQIISYGLRQFPAGEIHDALIEARAFIQSKQEVGA